MISRVTVSLWCVAVSSNSFFLIINNQPHLSWCLNITASCQREALLQVMEPITFLQPGLAFQLKVALLKDVFYNIATNVDEKIYGWILTTADDISAFSTTNWLGGLTQSGMPGTYLSGLRAQTSTVREDVAGRFGELSPEPIPQCRPSLEIMLLLSASSTFWRIPCSQLD